MEINRFIGYFKTSIFILNYLYSININVLGALRNFDTGKNFAINILSWEMVLVSYYEFCVTKITATSIMNFSSRKNTSFISYKMCLSSFNSIVSEILFKHLVQIIKVCLLYILCHSS